MVKRVTVISLIVMFAAAQLWAVDGFERIGEVPIPEADLNDGGIGNMVAGVDVDDDGNMEMYLVNDNTYDGSTEVIPRIYKLEYNGTTWDSVWSAVAPVAYQNTWPGLTLDDLDGDGLQEIIWGPVNATSTEHPNPYRIVVYEEAGDGSDVMGVDDGAGGYDPNSVWTITGDDDVNLRPTKFVVADIDDDGTKELIFDDRKGQNGGYFFGVASVDSIPYNGDGTETWTLEVSGQDFELGTLYNKWDVAVVGNNAYFPCEWQIAKLSWDGSQWTYDSLPPMAGGPSFNSWQTVDLDADGTEEIVGIEYAWGNYGPYGEDTTRIMLLQEDGSGGLTHTPLFVLPTSVRGIGGDHGDIDQDGNMDFLFGTRDGIPNATIYRVEYNGGTAGDITDTENWSLSYADSAYMTFESSGFGVNGIWDVISIANIDDDPEMEVLYTSSTGVSAGLGQNESPPVVVLDYTAGVGALDELVIAEEVMLGDSIPVGYLFKPGRILDGGNTIWFMGVNGSTKETYVFRSVDGGETFTYNATPIAGRGAQMDAYDADVALVSTASGKIFKTADGGATFTEVYSYTLGLGDGWFDGLRVLNSTVAVAFGDEASNGDMHFVRTTDNGDNWTEITGIDYLNAAYGYYTWGLGACNVGESIWCAGLTAEYDSGYVFRSYDAGVNWESFQIPNTIMNLYPRAITFLDDNNGMITDRYGDILKSADGGETWETVDLHPNGGWANGVVAIPGTGMIFAMDDNGVFYTSDMGTTWGMVETPAETESDYFTGGVFLNEEFGYVFTYNGQVLRFQDMVVDVKEEPVKKPQQYRLSQNYPNPFNPTTTISFEIPRNEHVRLTIYDMLGHEVISLVDRNMNQGQYHIQWNGINKHGQRVATGVYLYQLRTDNMVKTRKMTFIK